MAVLEEALVHFQTSRAAISHHVEGCRQRLAEISAASVRADAFRWFNALRNDKGTLERRQSELTQQRGDVDHAILTERLAERQRQLPKMCATPPAGMIKLGHLDPRCLLERLRRPRNRSLQRLLALRPRQKLRRQKGVAHARNV